MTTAAEIAPAADRPGIDWRAVWRATYQAVLSLFLALLVGGVLLLASGQNPFLAYQSLIYGAFGSVDRFAETLVKATPLLLVAISVSISFRCQVWNIGAEGQVILGAIVSTWLALSLPRGLPPVVVVLIAFAGGALGGAAWSLIAGLLKAYAQANEVITTTMLNYIAIYLLAFLVHGPLKDPAGFNFPQSPLLAPALQLPHLIRGTRLNLAFAVALLAVVGALLYWRSTLGLRTEIVGASRRVGRQVGISVPLTIVLVSGLAGALAGIAGWGDIFGLHFRLIEQIAVGIGSLGVVVALLGELHPIGMVFAAFLFGALVVGGNAMERNAGVPFALVDVIQGCVILLILARGYIFRFGKGKR